MNRPQSFLPKIIYIAEDSREVILTKRICQRMPWAELRFLPEPKDPISELELFGSQQDLPLHARIDLGKRILLLRRQKGRWMRACPGTQHHVCCNLWTVDPGEGCPLDCTYCYLQNYLRRNPTLKLFTNTQDLYAEIRERAKAEPERLFRVCTGEVIDSMVWDEFTDASLELAEVFSECPNAVLELKTKWVYLDNLLAIPDYMRKNVVISWSVNAPQVSEEDEAHTSPLAQRIKAAGILAEAGYRVGFHFDPIVHFSDWKEGYSATAKEIIRTVPVERIAWISLSTLRYAPAMQDIMRQRFPSSRLPYGDQFLAKDGKLRYVQPLRFAMLRHLWKQFKQHDASIPVYMCMESSAAWRSIAGGAPVAGEEIQEVFGRKGRQRLVAA